MARPVAGPAVREPEDGRTPVPERDGAFFAARFGTIRAFAGAFFLGSRRTARFVDEADDFFSTRFVDLLLLGLALFRADAFRGIQEPPRTRDTNRGCERGHPNRIGHKVQGECKRGADGVPGPGGIPAPSQPRTRE